MALLTTDEVRQHVEADLSDEALGRLIDDCEAEIERRFGPLSTEIAVYEEPGRANNLILERPADSITKVTETIVSSDGSEEETELETDDYKLIWEGRFLKRLPGGTNGRRWWGDRVEVEYAPEDESARRKRVLIDLVKLEVRYTASEDERLPDYSARSADYKKERERLLAALERWPWA